MTRTLKPGDIIKDTKGKRHGIVLVVRKGSLYDGVIYQDNAGGRHMAFTADLLLKDPNTDDEPMENDVPRE